MRRLTMTVLAVALVAAMTSAAVAADSVAVVDLERVMKSLKATKDAEQLLEKKLEEIKQQKEEMQEKLDTQRDILENLREAAENPMLSDDARKKKADEFRVMVNEYQRLEMDARRSLSKSRQQLDEQSTEIAKQIVGELREVVEQYAKDKKIDLVLDKGALGMAGAEMVLFASDKLDITVPILKIALDKEVEE